MIFIIILKNDIFLEEELSILREREYELLIEIDRLKAQLFKQEQNDYISEDKETKTKLGLNTNLDIDNHYQPLLKIYQASRHKAGDDDDNDDLLIDYLFDYLMLIRCLSNRVHEDD